MAYTPPWMADLQPASWRGVQFHVSDINFKTGRRVAVHEYPYKDKPWVEDMGLGPQEISFEGYLLGDDVASQYEEFKKATDERGHGELVHPRLGSRTVALIGAAFGEGREASNMISVSLVFLETATSSSGMKLDSGLSSFSKVGDAFDNFKAGSIKDFVTSTSNVLKAGQSAVQGVTQEAQSYVRQAQGVVRDATRAVNAVKPIANILGVRSRTFGRFMAPLRTVSTGLNTVNGVVGATNRATTAVTSLINGSNKAVGLVADAGSAVTNIAGKLK